MVGDLILRCRLGLRLFLNCLTRPGRNFARVKRADFNPTTVFLAAFAVSVPLSSASAAPGFEEIVLTNSFSLDSGSTLPARIIIRTSHITIDGNGALLQGPGRLGDLKSLEEAGIGIQIDGAVDVTLKRFRVRGFATGLFVRDSRAVSVTDCDFSDNYHNPAHGWDEMPARGGIRCELVRESVFRHNQAERVWNGLDLIEAEANLVVDNDFSHCSNTAVKLWRSSRNQFHHNNLSYGIRIDRAAGEVHARDSTGVLIETGSNNNYWFGNDVTHGGDGIFIRPLNRWISSGNVFIENDTSYANNNCVESWSPGNTFIRNKANYGSYGFWLGGSDQTVLIGNEAAFNGLTNGNHNAPEPGFQHGGLVIVGGPGSHTLIQGNNLHDNNGAGLVFRGDEASKGHLWHTEHWVVQQNRIAQNRFGVWGRWANAILLAQNQITNNAQGDFLTNITNWLELESHPEISRPPQAHLTGPEVATVGETLRFDASDSSDPSGHPLRYHWWLNGETENKPVLERVFNQPGFYRLGLTVDNGALADLAWRDLLVVQPVVAELGTENNADGWGFELENDNGTGKIHFDNDSNSIVGKKCLRFRPDPYPGAYATAVYPANKSADWDFSGQTQVRFWIRTQNPNLPGFQNAGPVLRLLTREGQIELRPAKDANRLNDPPWSEARWLWMPVVIPIAGDGEWQSILGGKPSLQHVNAISISLDSWGGEPFMVWLDGLTVD